MSSTDPSLDALLSDPLILALMKADRVDPVHIRAKFSRIGADIARRRRERCGSDRHPRREGLKASFAVLRSAGCEAGVGGPW